MTDLRYLNSDNGNCRIYYKTTKGSLVCFQQETTFGKIRWGLYVCSRDGEPSHEVIAIKIGVVESPKGDERIEREFRSFITNPNWRNLTR